MLVWLEMCNSGMQKMRESRPKTVKQLWIVPTIRLYIVFHIFYVFT